jgi:hypothetical protein
MTHSLGAQGSLPRSTLPTHRNSGLQSLHPTHRWWRRARIDRWWQRARIDRWWRRARTTMNSLVAQGPRGHRQRMTRRPGPQVIAKEHIRSCAEERCTRTDASDCPGLLVSVTGIIEQSSSNRPCNHRAIIEQSTMQSSSTSEHHDGLRSCAEERCLI